MDRVFLYGLGINMEVKMALFLNKENVSVRNLTWAAKMMCIKNADVAEVYAIDSQPGLYSKYKEAKNGDIYERILFRNMLEVEGLKIGV